MIVPLGLNDNVATFDTAPGYKKYKAICSTIEDEESEDDPTMLADLNMVSEDKQEDEDGSYEGMSTRKEDFWLPMRAKVRLGDNVTKDNTTFDINNEDE